MFLLCDLINLVLQANGDAISSTTVQQREIQVGIDVIIAGFIAQVVSLLMFICLGLEFGLRVYRQRGEMDERHGKVERTRLWRAFLIGTIRDDVIPECNR